LNCLYNYSNASFWQSEDANLLLENYPWKVAYRKAALEDYLNFQISQPVITRQYLVRKKAESNALIISPKTPDTFPEKES
jgi:hypothetical protein